jgi:hypothetical protein
VPMKRIGPIMFWAESCGAWALEPCLHAETRWKNCSRHRLLRAFTSSGARLKPRARLSVPHLGTTNKAAIKRFQLPGEELAIDFGLHGAGGAVFTIHIEKPRRNSLKPSRCWGGKS